MKSLPFPCLAIFILLSLATCLFARILNVPDDFDSIQDAIDSSEPGDTILVQPGTYDENLLIEDHGITLASLILTTGDPAYIDSTIIDGGGREGLSVVRFDEDGDAHSILTGFIITGGTGSPDIENDPCGGGIHCLDSSPVLTHLKIVDNEARIGAGIFPQRSSPLISHCQITNNHAVRTGGGIYISREPSNVTIEYTLIARNSAEEGSGGLGIFYGATAQLINVTVADNEGGGANWGIGPVDHAELSLRNCLVWGNVIRGLNAEEHVTLDYTNVQDGREAIIQIPDLEWGEGNIDADPLFTDAENGDYTLTYPSPCIDAGDPESPLDPDSTRADMGAFHFTPIGLLSGYVYDTLTDEPVEGATIYMSSRDTALTDADGNFSFNRLPFLFDLTVSHPGFADYVEDSMHVELGDTVDIEIPLMRPVPLLSRQELSATLEYDSSAAFDITLENQGNHPLVWHSRFTTPDDNIPEWGLMRSYPIGEILNSNRVEGVVFVDSLFYVTEGRGDPKLVHKLNRGGEVVGAFRQPGEGRWGMYDLAWDGELIWGSGEQRVYGIDLEGEVQFEWEGPSPVVQAIAYDSDLELLWLLGITSRYIYAFNRNGQALPQRNLERMGWYIYALAYHPDDPDGYPLYVFYNDIPNGEYQGVSKYNTETGDTMFVHLFEQESPANVRGACITNQFERFRWTAVVTIRSAQDNLLNVYNLGSDVFWLDLDTRRGTLEPDEFSNLNLTISAAELEAGEYDSDLVFDFPEVRSQLSLPIHLTVRPMGVGDEAKLPFEFVITGVHPNPFNAETILSYTLPTEDAVLLTIYDLSGRAVQRLDLGNQPPGSHTVHLDGQALASGVYLARLSAGKQARTIKLVSMK